ncbi:hypothetical protein BJ964_002060 [Actinoplanes lobatus]|uniref:Uncharacterized protein n=1 Tax=Actinoplanes lobatus TaxID=113568 RepID=A0A7W7HCA3_9ACTN|nr:hypothetical protein [Actinoplanes lobatus]
MTSGRAFLGWLPITQSGQYLWFVRCPDPWLYFGWRGVGVRRLRVCPSAGDTTAPRSRATPTVAPRQHASAYSTGSPNAKEPLTLFGLQSWLVRLPVPATEPVLREVHPSHADRRLPGRQLFARSVRSVFVNREAVALGAAGNETGSTRATELAVSRECQHWRAGACCDPYTSKPPHRNATVNVPMARHSTLAAVAFSSVQLSRRRQSRQRTSVGIPVIDDECVVADNDDAAVERLLV